MVVLTVKLNSMNKLEVTFVKKYLYIKLNNFKLAKIKFNKNLFETRQMPLKLYSSHLQKIIIIIQFLVCPKEREKQS